MGVCCNSDEQGISTRAQDQQAVGGIQSSQSSIDNQALMQSMNDGLKQRLILSFKCKDLPNTDKKSGSKTDAYIALFLVGNPKPLGITEVVNDNLNPDFVTPIEVDFLFEENQKFIMKVYDADDGEKL